MKIFKNIQNILFDLGGVLFDVDINKTIKAFQQFDFEDYDAAVHLMKSNHIFEKIETGEIDSNIFCNELRKLMLTPVPNYEIIIAWNAMLIGIPKENIQLIHQLSTKYSVFLLSNTNEIHYTDFSNQITRQYQLDKFEDLFTKAYYSHELGMRKPDPKIYEHVLADSQLIAEETLFIDDRKENIQAANKLKIKTIHYQSNNLVQLFTDNQLI